MTARWTHWTRWTPSATKTSTVKCGGLIGYGRETSAEIQKVYNLRRCNLELIQKTQDIIPTAWSKTNKPNSRGVSPRSDLSK